MLNKIIEKPVQATVISILLVLLGLLGLQRLPLQQFPDIAPPAVLVTATYPGANAETVLRAVAPSLEEAINGVEGMTYISSTASNDGTLAISVYFRQGINADQAQVNVQNRVSTAMSQLPAEVLQQGINTVKQQNGLIAGVGLFSTDTSKFDQKFLVNYAQINIIPEIKRIAGISSATILGGSKDYAMRIWLDPARMAAAKLTPAEVMQSIRNYNLESAPGKFGEGSDAVFEYVIKYKGKLYRPEEYENIIIRSGVDASVLRLKDVARVELGSYSYNSATRQNGQPGVSIGVVQLPGSNANELQIALDELMSALSKKFPAGISYSNFYRTKTSLDQSIAQVRRTLIEAFILVFLVVWLFLQDLRSTIIPVIAVPVAIIGTFFFMHLFGLSVNLLTLFAIVLAIGIVVDDAIVVVEAVHGKMERERLSAKDATKAAMDEISGAVISITLVMAAVFLPVGFMTGSTGIFYRQFAFTIAIAILISALNALTLSPVLTALLLKPTHRQPLQSTTFGQRFAAGFNKSFDRFTRHYTGGIRWLISHKWIAAAGFLLLTISTLFLIRQIKTGFIPTEDKGFVVVSITTPPGSSLAQTQKTVRQAEQAIRSMPATRFINLVSGFNLLTSSNSPSSAVAFVLLKEIGKRGSVEDIDGIQEQMRQKLAAISGGNFFVFTFPTVPGFSNVESLELMLQDKTGGQMIRFGAVATDFIEALQKRKEIGLAFTQFKTDYPQLQLEIDESRAALFGIQPDDILQTLQGYLGSIQASDFNRFGKYYRVILQADVKDRAEPSTLDGIFVRNNKGEMVAVTGLIKLKRVYGSETVSRFNLFNAISINVVPAPGFSTGDAIRAVRETAEVQLPVGFSFDFAGQTREEISASGQSAIIFILSLLFVYLLLAAQYESYFLPIAVLLTLPAGIFGVFAALGITGIENNIYVQVALIMLIGLLAKNAILIIEFARKRRVAGDSLITAAHTAAKLRLRPIIMTSLAFIAGILPMLFASGPSARGNHSISISALGGMIAGVSIGIFIAPILFIVFQRLHEWISGRPAPDGNYKEEIQKEHS